MYSSIEIGLFQLYLVSELHLNAQHPGTNGFYAVFIDHN